MAVITSSFFAIDLEVLCRHKGTIGLLGTILGLLEGIAIFAAAVLLQDFPWLQGGILFELASRTDRAQRMREAEARVTEPIQ